MGGGEGGTMHYFRKENQFKMGVRWIEWVTEWGGGGWKECIRDGVKHGYLDKMDMNEDFNFFLNFYHNTFV